MPAQPTILLVDDSRFFLTIEKQFLKNVPAHVLEAQSAEGAMDLCRKQPPDLIYMSCELPGTSGFECCRRMKSDGQFGPVPVILICDSDRPEQVELCKQAGSNAILIKPLDRHRFLEIGRSFLSGIREKRRHCLFRVRGAAGERKFTGKGLDISGGGMFLQTSEALAAGDILNLEIQLSRTDQSAGPWITCTGLVAWVNAKENPLKPSHPLGFGVKFSEVAQQSLAVLNGFLKSLDE